MFIAAFISACLAPLRRAEIRRQLGAMNDHMLDDIGISRDQIDAVAAGLHRREITQRMAPTGSPAGPRLTVNSASRDLATS